MRAGLEDESVEPGRLTELFPIGVSSENVRVKFYLPKKEVINLAIYDITGRKIKTIENGLINSGLNIRRVKLDYPSGVYFIRLRVEGESLTEKMILVR